METANRRSLIPWALRSHLYGVLGMGLGLGISIMVTAPAYLAAANVVAGGLRQLGEEAQPIAQSLVFLTGPVERLDTIGGYVSYKIFPTAAVLLAVYAAIQGAQLIRGSESKGLFDLWYAAAKTRSAIFFDRLVAFAGALFAITFLIWVLTVVGCAIAQDPLVLQAAGQSVAVMLVAVFAFALSLFASQFFATARTAAAFSSLYLIASYFIANMYGSIGSWGVIRYLSPFFYYLQARTLVPGISFDVAAMLVLLAASAILITAAWRLYLRRDVNGVALARIQRNHSANYSFRPSLISRRSLWLNWIAEQPVGLLSWCAAIGFFTALEISLTPTALKLFEENGGRLAKILKARGQVLTESTFLSAFMSTALLIVAAFAVTQVARWVADAAQHRNDVTLTYPVSMLRYLIERGVTLIAVSVIVVAGMMGGALIGGAIGNVSLDMAGLARTALVLVLLSFAIGGFGLLMTTWLRTSAATALAAGLIAASFVLSLVAPLLKWPDWASAPSLLHAFGAPYLQMPPAGDLIYLGGLGLAGIFFSYLAMRLGARIAL